MEAMGPVRLKDVDEAQSCHGGARQGPRGARRDHDRRRQRRRRAGLLMDRMTTPRKFIFDASFDQPQAPVTVLVDKPRAAAGADLHRRRARGGAAPPALAEGREAALAEAAASIERQLAARRRDAGVAALPALLARDGEIRDDVERRAARAAARARRQGLAGAVAARADRRDRGAGRRDCLHEAVDEPRVVLRVVAARRRADAASASPRLAPERRLRRPDRRCWPTDALGRGDCAHRLGATAAPSAIAAALAREIDAALLERCAR